MLNMLIKLFLNTALNEWMPNFLCTIRIFRMQLNILHKYISDFRIKFQTSDYLIHELNTEKKYKSSNFFVSLGFVGNCLSFRMLCSVKWLHYSLIPVLIMWNPTSTSNNCYMSLRHLFISFTLIWINFSFSMSRFMKFWIKQFLQLKLDFLKVFQPSLAECLKITSIN